MKLCLNERHLKIYQLRELLREQLAVAGNGQTSRRRPRSHANHAGSRWTVRQIGVHTRAVKQEYKK